MGVSCCSASVWREEPRIGMRPLRSLSAAFLSLSLSLSLYSFAPALYAHIGRGYKTCACVTWCKACAMQDIVQDARHARQVHMPAEGDKEEARPKKKQRRLQRAGACGYCMALQAPVPTP